MAINKEIIQEAGLNTSYHRILDIDINYILNQCILSIENYVSYEYRDKAKKKTEVQNSINSLMEQLNKTTDSTLIESLQEKIINLQESNKELLENDFAASIEKVTLDFIPENCTIEGFYHELMKMDKYKDSTLI